MARVRAPTVSKRSPRLGPISKLVLVVSAIVLTIVLHRATSAAARYLHPSNYGLVSYRDLGQMDSSMPMLKRHNFDGQSGSGAGGGGGGAAGSGPDDDYEADDGDETRDQSAAASYRSQDDGPNSGQANDGFDDNELGEWRALFSHESG